MKTILVTFLALCAFFVASAQDTDKVKALEERVQLLERRLARLERVLANSKSTPEAKKMMEVARQHVALERKNFKSYDIAAAERLYQKSSQTMSDSESKNLLDSIVSAYPQLNRAGCAQLYRAQREAGYEKERLLKDCIDRFYECYYLDGAQVGPLAVLQLASYYKEIGRVHDADKLFKQLRNKSPEAVSHGGTLLIDEIE